MVGFNPCLLFFVDCETRQDNNFTYIEFSCVLNLIIIFASQDNYWQSVNKSVFSFLFSPRNVLKKYQDSIEHDQDIVPQLVHLKSFQTNPLSRIHVYFIDYNPVAQFKNIVQTWEQDSLNVSVDSVISYVALLCSQNSSKLFPQLQVGS